MNISLGSIQYCNGIRYKVEGLQEADGFLGAKDHLNVHLKKAPRTLPELELACEEALARAERLEGEEVVGFELVPWEKDQMGICLKFKNGCEFAQRIGVLKGWELRKVGEK